LLPVRAFLHGTLRAAWDPKKAKLVPGNAEDYRLGPKSPKDRITKRILTHCGRARLRILDYDGCRRKLGNVLSVGHRSKERA